MTGFFKPKLAKDNQQNRESIFNGDVYLVEGEAASIDLVKHIKMDMEAELETNDIRKAHRVHSEEELFNRMGKLRRHFYESPEYHDRLRNVAEENGFARDCIAFDPIRIRVVLPGGHRNPKAAPVYYPHRDTWYAHPESLIVWWIPLHDLRPDETFVFYPEYFNCAVDNNSEIFDYSDWIKDGPALKIGWQKNDSGITGGYPEAKLDTSNLKNAGFACDAASNLIFAGAHFRETLPQDFDTIRFSLDFRIVHLDDIANQCGAPNCDNRSMGSTLKDYIQPLAI